MAGQFPHQGTQSSGTPSNLIYPSGYLSEKRNSITDGGTEGRTSVRKRLSRGTTQKILPKVQLPSTFEITIRKWHIYNTCLLCETNSWKKYQNQLPETREPVDFHEAPCKWGARPVPLRRHQHRTEGPKDLPKVCPEIWTALLNMGDTFLQDTTDWSFRTPRWQEKYITMYIYCNIAYWKLSFMIILEIAYWRLSYYMIVLEIAYWKL